MIRKLLLGLADGGEVATISTLDIGNIDCEEAKELICYKIEQLYNRLEENEGSYDTDELN